MQAARSYPKPNSKGKLPPPLPPRSYKGPVQQKQIMSPPPKKSRARRAKQPKQQSFNWAGLGNSIVSMLPTILSGAKGLFELIEGFGDYQISQNTLMGTKGSDLGTSPGVFGHANGSITVTHREFIGDLQTPSTGTFNLATIINNNTSNGTTRQRINPLNAVLFPFLASIAANYEIWRPEGIIFEKKASTSVAISSTTNIQMGISSMSTQYNAQDPPFVSKQDMSQYQWTTSKKITEDFIHPVECDPKLGVTGNGNYYIYGKQQSTNVSDDRLSDLGIINYYDSGFPQAQNTTGEWWVTYQVWLGKPRKPGRSAWADHYQLGATATTSAYFGAVIPSPSTSSNLGTGLTNTTITFPSWFQGNVQIILVWYGDSTACVRPTFTGTNGVSSANLYATDGANTASVSVTTTNFIEVLTFTIAQPTSTNSVATITLSGGTIPANVTGGDLFIHATSIIN